jgi:hypothetical protein
VTSREDSGTPRSLDAVDDPDADGGSVGGAVDVHGAWLTAALSLGVGGTAPVRRGKWTREEELYTHAVRACVFEGVAARAGSTDGVDVTRRAVPVLCSSSSSSERDC